MLLLVSTTKKTLTSAVAAWAVPPATPGLRAAARQQQHQAAPEQPLTELAAVARIAAAGAGAALP